MKLIERIVFSDLLLAIAKVPAKPYNWLINARMMFIFYGDCLTTREEYESQSLESNR